MTLPQVRLVRRDWGRDRSLKSSRQTVSGWRTREQPQLTETAKGRARRFFDLQCVYTELRERETEGRESKDMNGAIVWTARVFVCHKANCAIALMREISITPGSRKQRDSRVSQ